MQVAIDNAKRAFDIDIPTEINRIKSDMDIRSNGLPWFWMITKKDKRKSRTDEQRMQKEKNNKKRIRERVNKTLNCPMNYLYGLNLNKYRDADPTIPITDFLVRHKLKDSRRKSRKVETLISKYSIDLYNYNVSEDDSADQYLLLKENFDELINDLRNVYISKDYAGLFSWLIYRAFCKCDDLSEQCKSKLSKNRSVLLKALYTVNPELLLKNFKKADT